MTSTAWPAVPQHAAQALEDEPQQRFIDRRELDALLPQQRVARVADQRAEVERQRRFHQDAQDAERGAAQAEGILVAGRHLADAEEADQRVELVGERHGTGDVALRGRVSPLKRGW
jgi:hypothetical protein